MRAVLKRLGRADQRGAVAGKEDRGGVRREQLRQRASGPVAGVQAVAGEGLSVDVEDALVGVGDDDGGR